MLVKRTISVVIAVISCCSCFAQAKVGFFAGPQTSTVQYKIQDVKQSSEAKYGFHAGVGMKVDFEERLYFFPAISYSKAGYKVAFNRQAIPPDSSAKDNNTSLHEVDLDLHLQVDLGKQLGHFFLRGGPSFNIIASGKEKFHVNSGETIDRKMKLGLYSPYGRFLVSAVAALGYETASGFYVNLQYAHGLTSINNADDGPQILQRVIGLNMGIFLHSKKIVLDTRNKE